MNDLVLAERRGPVFRITLNRPGKRNCIDLPMLRLLDEKLAEIEREMAVRVVVIQGAGTKAFSSGGDLKAFAALGQEEIAGWIKLGNQVFSRLECLPKPTIAAINGYAFGGGLELALACDFRLATTTASFASPELQHGWVPGWGGMTRLRRLLGESRAKEIVFLGDILDAQDAFRVGLAHRVVESDRLEAEVDRLVERLAALNPAVFECAKSALTAPAYPPFDSAVLFQLLVTRLARVVSESK